VNSQRAKNDCTRVQRENLTSVLAREFFALNSCVVSSDPDLVSRIRQLGLRPEDFEESFSRSGGPGSQNVNKVSTAVTFVHRPSGISVTAQDTRSQYRNRQLAIHRLIALIEKKRREQAAERRDASERARRQTSKRPRSLKREIRKSKEHRSVIKHGRSKVSAE
jgi:protein subunit release factor B